MDMYLLNPDHTVRAVSYDEWALAQRTKAADYTRRVDRTEIGSVVVSTVFLGMDHSFDGGKPLLFETMAFGGALDQEPYRTSTWDEAVAEHKRICELVRNQEN